jgi:AraC family transcriptional regulator
MGWVRDITRAISYIENNILEDITIEDIARTINLSPFYFQKGFAFLCNMSVTEYIRNRRLSLAGKDLQTGDNKVIDIALKYGYESPDSFTKAFTRFHGITPSAVKNGEGELNYFMPLRIKIEMKGGFEMDVKIVKKSAFTLVGYSKLIGYEEGYAECPKFWNEHFMSGRGETICGIYGVCIDDDMQKGKFKYMIADDYIPSKEYPSDTESQVIKEGTWAVFPCIGKMPNAIQEVNTKIYKEWLPNNPDYDINHGYSIEFYADIRNYPKGNQDENYYSEIWIPIKTKK